MPITDKVADKVARKVVGKVAHKVVGKMSSKMSSKAPSTSALATPKAPQSAPFPKEYRLSGRKNITQLLSHGKTYRTPHMRILTAPQAGLLCVRVIFIIPKRLLSMANQRNLVRRRLRHAHREQLAQIKSAQTTPNVPNVPTSPSTSNLHIAYVYTSHQIQPYAVLQAQVQEAFKKISKKQNFLKNTSSKN